MLSLPADDEPEAELVAAPRPLGLYDAGNQDTTGRKRSDPKEAALANDRPLPIPRQVKLFEQVMLPHLDSAYNLARWLTGNDHDADDVVQDAYMRALEFFGSFRGGDGRPWLLTIVRHACFDRLARQRPHQPLTVFDEETHSDQAGGVDPLQLVLGQENRELLHQAVGELPLEFREVLVLRELEGLSYKEIATVTNLPAGTIMSRLARARERLRQSLVRHLCEEP
jgi:RNA polymerase sigma-70 factor (ECF subfamily)